MSPIPRASGWQLSQLLGYPVLYLWNIGASSNPTVFGTWHFQIRQVSVNHFARKNWVHSCNPRKDLPAVFKAFALEAVFTGSRNSGLFRGHWMSVFVHRSDVFLPLPLGLVSCCSLIVSGTFLQAVILQKGIHQVERYFHLRNKRAGWFLQRSEQYIDRSL